MTRPWYIWAPRSFLPFFARPRPNFAISSLRFCTAENLFYLFIKVSFFKQQVQTTRQIWDSNAQSAMNLRKKFFIKYFFIITSSLSVLSCSMACRRLCISLCWLKIFLLSLWSISPSSSFFRSALCFLISLAKEGFRIFYEKWKIWTIWVLKIRPCPWLVYEVGSSAIHWLRRSAIWRNFWFLSLFRAFCHF